MSQPRQAVAWIAALFAGGVLLYLLRGMLLPFVAGMAVAYLLDPLADRLERRGLSRTLATALITGAFLLVAVALLLWLLPMLYVQLRAFLQRLPQVLQAVRQHLLPLIDDLGARLGFVAEERLQAAAADLAQYVVPWLVDQLGSAWQSGLAVFQLLSLVVITPVVAFYLIRDWGRLTEQIDSLLPRAHADVIRDLLRQIDGTLAGFARGQALVCLILATFYSVSLSAMGLEFGVVVGIGAGLVSFIPVVGALSGAVAAIALAILQFGLVPRVALVAAVFAVGQAIEGNVLTPRLVGERVRLHPVWMMFAMLAGASLFGFVGVLLAVPVAAVVGVLVRFGISRYRQSALYRGDGEAA
ncbi:MAG: AI-2E family transporter [Alphaproteobacteria bacterium]|nr:AI-2E family transporter [Alphaproteobacteria bacterium]